MVLNAKDDGTVVVERTVNKNAGRVKFDMEDVLRAAYGQPDEVFTYQGGELLPPPTQLPDPLESGDKVDVREYLLFLDAYFTTLRMTEGAGATGAAALADAYTIMRKEYEQLSAETQKEVRPLPVRPPASYTENKGPLDALFHSLRQSVQSMNK